ncbi:MAG: SusC/RagA family TonB-linked outer membrane protein [Prevotella sp.]|nr:SusC/RagA family TonB-linked outer membrane protein [Prevotella sp.]
MEKRLTMFLACLFLTLGGVLAQTKVTGTVISAEDSEPIVGASVIVQGQRSGVVTDADGRFSINVPAGKKINISYIGMDTETVTPRNGMRVVLHNSAELEEVVVTGMQKMDKRLFTGSTTKVDAKDAKIDGVADISRSLEGRAAGVSVQNVSGTFGTAPKIRVRGATSIYGSSKPLWVVDGVIMEDVVEVNADELSSGDASTLISSAIAGLNADDIESFQILKDGSATSIYGARAMAGVIVVTTKKGKAGQAKINYTGEYTMRLVPSYSTFNIMNSQDQMAVYQELAQKGYLNYAEISNQSDSGVYGKMYELLSTYDPTTQQFLLPNTSASIASYLRDAEYRNTNWFDELFSNSIQHNHSIGITAGTDKVQFYASLSAMFDPGWYKQSKVERYTANMNTTYKVSNKVSLNMIANASFRKQRAPGTLSSDVDAVNGEVKRDFDINPYSYALNTSRAMDANTFYTRNYAPFNILHELDNNYMDLGVNDFRAQMKLDYKPIHGLELSVLGAVKYSTNSQEHFILDNSNQALAYRAMATTVIRDNNPFLYKDPDPDKIYELPITVLPDGGIYERNDRSMFGWDFRASAQYNNVFADDHIVNLYAGLETNSGDRHSTWFRGWGMQYELGEIPNYAYQVFKKGAEQNTEYYTLVNRHTRSAAFFANATYSYKGRYTLNGTYRYEGTNGVGRTRQSRWLPTWNIAGTWNAHEESWFKNVFKQTMTHLTLKASYSLTADRPSVTNAVAILRSRTPWRPFAGVKESGIYQSYAGNSDLTYEKKHELNLGLEAGFLNNRINFTFDWYNRRNYDLIGPLYTEGTSGDITRYGNIAAMKSNGVELSLTTKNIQTKDFSWTTNFIYSHTHNKITDLQNDSRIIDLVRGTGFAKQGYPVRALFSIPFMGLNEEGLPTFLDQDGNISTTGIYFQESDPEKLGFLKYEGPTDPTDMGSLGNIFKWKGLTLNVFVTYSFGNVVRLDPVFRKKYNDLMATPKEFANRWEVPGDEKYTNIPVIANARQNQNDTHLSYAYNAYNYSDVRIAKGDFIRMKEISVSYEFPKHLISPMNLSNLSLKLQATNLFLIYADKKLNGQDPEFFNTGGVASPMPKQFTLTLRLGL